MRTWKIYIGIMLIILSAICWVLIFSLGKLELNIAQVSAITATLMILAKILFWPGIVLIIGTKLWIKFKKNLSPRHWFKKNNQ